MKGTYLKIYVHENRRHHGKLLYEWLLEKAKSMGIHGGSAFRAVAGYGRHGVMHEEHFFELAADFPVEVVFVISEEEAGRFIDFLKNENIPLFYVTMPVECGLLGDGSSAN